MVCAFKHYTVPYGVVELGQTGISPPCGEKPELDFLTNTGVYVVEPRVVEEMRDGGSDRLPRRDRPLPHRRGKDRRLPIGENSWMDMGQLEELEKMRRKLENQS